VWSELGFADTCAGTIRTDLAGAGITEVRSQEELGRVGALPAWLGSEDFHRAHRSSLVRKDPEFYGPRFPDVPDDLPYVWPRPGEGSDAASDTASDAASDAASHPESGAVPDPATADGPTRTG
jgi:hypothetical protein